VWCAAGGPKPNELRPGGSIPALPPELGPPPWPQAPDETLLGDALAAWARVCPRPLVLFFDEIDALRGASLISVLRQLRAGFNERPAGFPASVALCGLPDVRGYSHVEREYGVGRARIDLLVALHRQWRRARLAAGGHRAEGLAQRRARPADQGTGPTLIPLMAYQVSRLCCGFCPGQLDLGDFFGCWLVGVGALESGRGDHPPERGGHVWDARRASARCDRVGVRRRQAGEQDSGQLGDRHAA
jgi:hypothetical protein